VASALSQLKVRWPKINGYRPYRFLPHTEARQLAKYRQERTQDSVSLEVGYRRVGDTPRKDCRMAGGCKPHATRCGLV